MSCCNFLIFMWVKGMQNVPTECIFYTDDPGVYKVVQMPSSVEEEDIDKNGNGK